LPALELEGRDIYIREGCNNCHSQMIRPLRAETERYGHYSVAGESVYNHPFLWGSKRTGPDLARVGKRYSDEWHRAHMKNPRDVVPESNMPGFPWLFEATLESSKTGAKMAALRKVGVPYTDEDIANAPQSMAEQAEQIEKSLYVDPEFERTYEADKKYAEENGLEFVEMRDREIVALIAYLQRLGTDIKIADTAEE